MSNTDDLTPAELASAAIDMDRVLEREPQLSDNGFKQFLRHQSRAERNAQFLKWREDMRHPNSLAQFMAARGWLRQFRKIKTLNRSRTSYSLKHCAEDDIGYATNGCFIAAAIAEGFTVRCVEPVPPMLGSTSRPRRGGMQSATGMSGEDAPIARRHSPKKLARRSKELRERLGDKAVADSTRADRAATPRSKTGRPTMTVSSDEQDGPPAIFVEWQEARN